jgi:hypothetical protein
MAETMLRHGPAPGPAAERYQVAVQVTAVTLAAGDANRDPDRCELARLDLTIL